MKERKPYYGSDQDPTFDENYHATNMPFHSCNTEDGKTVTNVIHLADDDTIVIGQYHNGVNTRKDIFENYESYLQWYEYEQRLHKAFQEWMKEYEKNKAKVIKMER